MDQARRLWRALGFPEYAGERAFTAADAQALRDGERRGRLGSARLRHRRQPDPGRRSDDGPARRLGGRRRWCSRIEEIEAGDDATGQPGRHRAAPGRPGAAGRSSGCWSTPGAATSRPRRPGSRRSAPTTRTCTRSRSRSASPTSWRSPRCPTSSTRTGSATWSRSSRPAAPTWSRAHRGRIIKSIGDSVLFVNDDPVRALETAEGIIDVIGRDSRMPDVRARTGQRLGGDADGRRLRPAGQPGRPADRGGPPQPGHRRPAPPPTCCRTTSSRPGGCRPARCAASGCVEPIAVRRALRLEAPPGRSDRARPVWTHGP